MLDEPLHPIEVKALLQSIRESGTTAASTHALQEMKKDNLDMSDVLNVLRAGVVEPGESENGSWRYRVRTQRMVVIVAFRSETEVRIVTAWRMKS